MTLTSRSFVLLAAGALLLLAVEGPPVRAEDQATPEAKSKPWPPIFQLVASGNVAGVKAALEADPSQANAEARGRMTPLGYALAKRNVEVARALLDGGADPNLVFGPPQMLPLQAAAAYESLDAIKALLAKGADPKRKDAIGGTALHVVAGNGLVAIAELLLDKGAEVNATFTAGPNVGATPVHLAAERKDLAMVTALAAHRPDWSLRWNGRTAAEVADSVGAESIAAYVRAQMEKSAALEKKGAGGD